MSSLCRFVLESRRSLQLIDITERVEDCLVKNPVDEGIVLVYTPHTTAGIAVNENADPAVCRDLEAFLSRNYSPRSYFTHGEGNSHAHIMSSLISPSETFIISGGRLVLGTWQGIFFCEFDGPRRRTVLVRGV